MTYQETIDQIKNADQTIYYQCLTNWDNVAKPLHSLGDFEYLTAKIGAAQGTTDICIDRKRVLVFCSDNGVEKKESVNLITLLQQQSRKHWQRAPRM